MGKEKASTKYIECNPEHTWFPVTTLCNKAVLMCMYLKEGVSLSFVSFESSSTCEITSPKFVVSASVWEEIIRFSCPRPVYLIKLVRIAGWRGIKDVYF